VARDQPTRGASLYDLVGSALDVRELGDRSGLRLALDLDVGEYNIPEFEFSRVFNLGVAVFAVCRSVLCDKQ
jgi:hypothetical protein